MEPSGQQGGLVGREAASNPAKSLQPSDLHMCTLSQLMYKNTLYRLLLLTSRHLDFNWAH